MRCLSCNRRLNDEEATRKYSSSGAYIDLCNRCFSYIASDIPDVESSGYVDTVDDGENDSDVYEFDDGAGIHGGLDYNE